MGDFTKFERGQIVGVLWLEHMRQKLPATLFGVSRAIFSKVMSPYTNRVKTTLAERNSQRKSTDKKEIAIQ
jgi:hypothetical protein